MNANVQRNLTSADRRELYRARDETYDPQTQATTRPGELAPEREERPPSGTGIVKAIIAVLAAAAASQLLYAAAQMISAK